MGAVVVSSWYMYLGARLMMILNIKSYIHVQVLTALNVSIAGIDGLPFSSHHFINIIFYVQCTYDVKRGEGVSKVNVIMTLIFQK